MKLILTLLTTATVLANVNGSLPAHAEAPPSIVNAAIEVTVDPMATQTIKPEDIDSKFNDTFDKIENEIVTSTEETIFSGNISPIANESCFGVAPAKPPSFPAPQSGDAEAIAA
jgi:hypothetical protein